MKGRTIVMQVNLPSNCRQRTIRASAVCKYPFVIVGGAESPPPTPQRPDGLKYGLSRPTEFFQRNQSSLHRSCIRIALHDTKEYNLHVPLAQSSTVISLSILLIVKICSQKENRFKSSIEILILDFEFFLILENEFTNLSNKYFL